MGLKATLMAGADALGRGAESLVEGVPGTLAGMLLGGWQDRRQLRQQGKLMQQQIEGSKEMGRFNTEQAFDLWQKTSYPEQLKQMKKAGLSPGLMYKGAGAGGTTGGAGGGSVSGGAAAGAQDTGAALDNAMKVAQIENLKKDIEVKDQGITESGYRISDIVEGISNKKAIRRLTNAQADFQELLTDIQDSNRGIEQEYLRKQVDLIRAQIRSAIAMADVDERTKDNKIKESELNLMSLELDNAFKQANIKKTEAEISRIAEETWAIGERLYWEGRRVMVAEKQSETQARAQYVDKVAKEFSVNHPNMQQFIGGMAADMWSMFKSTVGMVEKHNYINDNNAKR